MFVLGMVVGYCVAVILPIPGVSRAILDGWSRVWQKVKEK